MPELPEVETVKRTLLGLIKGKTIKKVVINYPKIIKLPDDVEQFKDAMIGETIEDIGRRGKFLLFYTTHYTMVAHLRMEGKYLVASSDEPVDKHTHVQFLFDDGTELRYHDVRKFGTMHLYAKGEEGKCDSLACLGPEPFDSAFTVEHLQDKLSRTSRKVKPMLLDQKAVVGLGNIYVDEVLHRAGIHPERESSSLSREEVEKLHPHIVQVLGDAVEKGGSTIRTYVNSQGKEGIFQNSLFVYGRKGEDCLFCGMPIEKMVVGGRGTHYCPNCQK